MKLKLTGKRLETADIWSFRFASQTPVSWSAGQSIRLELPRKTWGYNERRFTISSLPHEGYLQITTRLSSSEFKQDLAKLPIGSIIDAYNIDGRIHWGDSRQPKLFIAGGTGITLFRVALAEAYRAKQDFLVTLLYSTKDAPILFEQELSNWQANQEGFELHMSAKRFTAEEILNKVPGASDSLIHIAGPDAMVFGLQKDLEGRGLSKQQLSGGFLT